MATPGTGSLWNPNSWHWETRTYTKWSEEHLRNALLNQCATHGPLAVKVTGVPTLVLDASVNIRKGRKFVVWELAKLTVDWKGYAPSGAVDRVTTGTLSLEFGGIMHDDVATDFPMRMTHTGTTAYDTTCRDIARAKLAPLVREAIRQWCAALAAHDDVLEAQAIAYRDREKAAEVASEVQLPSPAPKPVLVPVTASVPAKAATTVEEKLAQLLVSEPNSASNSNSSGNDLLAATKVEEPLAVSPAAHAAPKSAPTPSEGSSASVRNPDSFLWEERSLTSWAKARLSELIGGIDIDVPGGSIKIVETKLKGDASVSLRRGKKYVFYEFTITCKWEGEMVDPRTGAVRGQGDGNVVIPDVDQDSGKDGDYVVEVSVDDDADADDHRLKELFRRHGVDALRAKVDGFFADVMAKAWA